MEGGYKSQMKTPFLLAVIAILIFLLLRKEAFGSHDDQRSGKKESQGRVSLTDGDDLPGRTTEMKADVCYAMQGHACSQVEWLRGPMNAEVKIGEGDALQLKIVPGLWGTGTISLLSCMEKKPHYVTYTGCDIQVTAEGDDEWYKRSASFIRHVDWFFNGFFALEAADFKGRFIANKNNILVLETQDDRSGFRLDASWVFAAGGNRVKERTLPMSVHMLSPPILQGTLDVVPQVFEEGEECSRDHKGCCSATDSDFTMPTSNELGPYHHKAHDACVVAVSSVRTIGARKSLLKRWLFDRLRAALGPWKRVVITLDCFTEEIDTSYPMTDWLVGPFGSTPGGIAPIAIRVNLALHWTFQTHRDTAFYFMTDDDTMVFSNHLIWALSYIDDPYSQIWYLGGGSEWKIKQFFHGNMAFGGGGVLISNYAGRVWLDKYPGSPENATRDWLMKGICSHEGGDGAFCRCMRHAAGRADIFTPFAGLHQFDVVGTAALLDDIRDTCPDCPSLYEQTGMWIDDIIGRSTVLTFHHFLAIDKGAVYPGLTGTQTGLLLMEAYDTHPPFLLARRVCGRSVNKTFTLCVNFGHRFQIFQPELPPDEAMILLDTSDGTNKLRPRTRLIRLGIRQYVQQSQLCSMTYTGAVGNNTFKYIGSRIEPRPAHDGGCMGEALLQIKNRCIFARVDFAELGQTIEWQQSVAHVVPEFTPK